MGFSDYNANPDLNTSISGVNIGEGCPPSGINNAIRQLMADAKVADGGYMKGTTSGGSQIVGSLTISGAANLAGGMTVTGDALHNNNIAFAAGTGPIAVVCSGNGRELRLFSTNEGLDRGAGIILYAGGATSNQGKFRIRAAESGSYYDLIGDATGELAWRGKVVAGGAQVGNLNASGVVNVRGWTSSGGTVAGYDIDLRANLNGTRGLYDPEYGKWIVSDNSAGNVVFSGTVAGSSDERLKGGIATIPDKTLDAWSKVDWRQYRYKADGAGAPVHFGVVAQHVSSCLAEGGVNPSGYALIENKALTEGGKDEWAVYYQEAFALEAAYQRRRADKAEERIADLERRLDALEAAFVAAGA